MASHPSRSARQIGKLSHGGSEFRALDAPPEFVSRHVDEVQFNGDAKATSRGSHLVAFGPRPEPKIEHDAQTEAQDFLGKAPEFVFDLFPGRPIPGVGAESREPFILREAHGAPVHG
jgi:hypothetical protein